MPISWTCTEMGASSTDCVVTATSTVMTNAVSYHDWLFVAMIVVGMLALLTWPRVFKPLKTLFYDN